MLKTYQPGCYREPKQSWVSGVQVPHNPSKCDFLSLEDERTQLQTRLSFCLFAVFREGGRRQQEINAVFSTPENQVFISDHSGYFH